MLSPSDRIAHLEAELAELRDLVAPAPPKPSRRPRLVRTFLVLGLALALMIPAGVVLATHTFDDVPTTHQFHTSISAIADAGITTGCPSPAGQHNYCPNGLVTRGQMAAFLSRLGALTPGSAPKVNADKLDGASAEAFARPLFAVVNQDGSLARGNGAVSSTQTAPPGDYLVTFNRNVTSCAYIATIGLTGAAGVPDPGQIDVVRYNANPNTVWVSTSDSAGTESDRPFHLMVLCAGGTGETLDAETSGPGTVVDGPAISSSSDNK